MRIAQVAPLFERVPPPGYGGVELIVAELTDELVRRDFDVTLFASGDSETLGHLEAVLPRALRLDPNIKSPAVYDVLQYARVAELADRFDLIHFHSGALALPTAACLPVPCVHTLHQGFNEDTLKLYTRYKDQRFFSISDNQRALAPHLNYVRTIPNGLSVKAYRFYEKSAKDPYLVFLGRMSPEKGPDRAIEMAGAAKLPLKLAGKIDKADRAFFEAAIEPQLDGKTITYLGELSQDEKIDLLGQASVALFPFLGGHQSFGLAILEAMAVGTPTIALRRGSITELIANGQTGFICNSLPEAIAAIPRAMRLNRNTCRTFVARYFSVQAMVDRYEAAYHKIWQETSQSLLSNTELDP